MGPVAIHIFSVIQNPNHTRLRMQVTWLIVPVGGSRDTPSGVAPRPTACTVASYSGVHVPIGLGCCAGPHPAPTNVCRMHGVAYADARLVAAPTPQQAASQSALHSESL